jgi:hypothetical protein
MRNEFTTFSYSKFRPSYNDLKLNCARLLAMYFFIDTKTYNLDLPTYTRKMPVNKEKCIAIAPSNERRFKEDYCIGRYTNINMKARSAGLYNYKEKMTKYVNDKFTK